MEWYLVCCEGNTMPDYDGLLQRPRVRAREVWGDSGDGIGEPVALLEICP